MDLPDAGAEARPSLPANLINPYYLLATLIVLVLVSCSQRKDEEEVQPPLIKKTSPDSAAIRQRQRADSIALVSSQKKKIYITFDDGPNAGTLNVLNAVIDEQVPASFFIVAKHTRDSRDQEITWEKLKATPGIELCNHSYSHAGNRYSRFYQEPQRVIADFLRSRDSLRLQNTVARMPGRNAWRIGNMRHTDVKESRKAIDSVAMAGFSIMGWDVEWGFDHQTFVPDADTSLMFRRMENLLRDSATRTPGHLVLLAHDQSFRTEADVQLLKAVLYSLKNHPDYELVLASSYPGVK